jgi:hypothetical protein
MSHNHDQSLATGNKLKYAIFLSITILVAEVIGEIGRAHV